MKRMHPLFYLQALIAKILLNLYRMVGLRAGSWMGAQLVSFLGKFARERHIAADNLRQALPHIPEDEQKIILDKCWSQLGRVVGEFPHMAKIAREAEQRVKIVGAEHVKAALPNGGPAMFVSGQLGIDDAGHSALGRQNRFALSTGQ